MTAKLKSTYTKKDLKKFDELLCVTELKGFGNYKRNIGRLDLAKWLKQFTKKTANEMFEKIKDE